MIFEKCIKGDIKVYLFIIKVSNKDALNKKKDARDNGKPYKLKGLSEETIRTWRLKSNVSKHRTQEDCLLCKQRNNYHVSLKKNEIHVANSNELSLSHFWSCLKSAEISWNTSLQKRKMTFREMYRPISNFINSVVRSIFCEISVFLQLPGFRKSLTLSEFNITGNMERYNGQI